MRRLNYLFMIIILTIIIAFIPTIVNANNSDGEEFGTETIEIQSTTNTYLTGTKLTIILKRELNVEITDIPVLIIQFGNGTEIEIKSDTQPGSINELQYTYTIQSSDKGELKILRTQQTTENGVTSTNLENIALNQTIIANNNSSDEESDITWTDFSNASYNWIDYTETDHSSPSIEIKGVDLKNIYYVHISHSESDEPDLTKIGEDINYWIAISNGKIYSTYLNSYLEENGDIYIWIVEVQNREEKIVVNAKKIERLEQLPLTKRIVGYFGIGEFTGGIFCYEPHTTNRKINVKIGKMTDSSILKKIKNNDANCMNDLLNYAKKAEAILEKTYSFATNPDTPDVRQLENNAYYYVYFELEDENGKYYPVEDVELYQASITGDKVDLINHTDRDFVYNIDETEDDTIAPDKLPQTGISIFIISLITVLVVVSALLAHRIKKYKDIK